MPSRTKKTEEVKEETPVEETAPVEDPKPEEVKEEKTVEGAPKTENLKPEEKPAEEKQSAAKKTNKPDKKPATKPAKKPATKMMTLTNPTPIFAAPALGRALTNIAGPVEVKGEVGNFYEVLAVAGGRNRIHGYIMK